MKIRWFAFALIAAMLVPSVIADNGKGKAKDKSELGIAKNDKSHGHQKGAKHRDLDERWERRDGFEFRTFGDRDSRPPGWSKGKKTGWGNCGVPPGQAKKGACRTYTYQGRRHYYYEDEAGRIVVRRPVIVTH